MIGGWFLESADARGRHPLRTADLTGRGEEDQTKLQQGLAVLQSDWARKVMTFGPLSFLRLEN